MATANKSNIQTEIIVAIKKLERIVVAPEKIYFLRLFRVMSFH